MWIKYWKKYWNLFCLGIFFLVIEAMCDLMQPTIMSKIIDIGVSQKNMDYVISKGMFMLAITGVGAVCAVLRRIIASHVSQKFGTDIVGQGTHNELISRCQIYKDIYRSQIGND